MTTTAPFGYGWATGDADAGEAIRRSILDLAREHGVVAGSVVDAVLALLALIPNEPKTIFEHPPEYVRAAAGEAIEPGPGLMRSTHSFFDVVTARASRRDFADAPLDRARLDSLLHWTFGKRDEAIAYDYRNAPLRYIPSSGGLCSTDAYVIACHVDGLPQGAYYYDLDCGLRLLDEGYMAAKITNFAPDQEWVGRAAAFVVLVANTERVVPKYGELALKLLLLDAGVAAGHAELVAAALELRSCLLGGLPPAELGRLLRLEGEARIPVVTLALGTRGGAS